MVTENLNNMNSSIKITIDENIIKEFFNEFDDLYDIVLNAVEQLEKKPVDDPALIHSLFRAVHSIKSNLQMVGLADVILLVHQLEGILEHVRKGKFSYVPEYGDIIRLALDEARVAIEKAFNKLPIAQELKYITNAIEKICAEDEQVRQEAIFVALNLLDPFIKEKKLSAEASSPSAEEEEEQNESQQTSSIYMTDDTYPYVVKDLDFFAKLSEIIEERTQTHVGKTKLVERIALKMNEIGNEVVDKRQLLAAIHLTNWGLGLLPLSITLNDSMLNDEEIDAVRSYPALSRDFFSTLPYWQPAAEIVFQCHERPDGSGYPNKLKNTDICPGAKIIAIAQAFVAILYSRPYQHSTIRTAMSALIEINKDAGTQFDEYWTDIFNKAIKQLHEKQLL